MDLAKQKRKGIVLENLKFDRLKEEKIKKKRRCFSNFTYSKLKERICVVAKREGVSVVEIDPAYTSIIGSLKYAPQFNLSRHTSAAMVIARRGLGFSENIPTAYQGIVSDTLLVSSQSGPSGEASKHQRKEEASVKRRKLQTAWSVLDVVILTGRSTGKNLSTLKRILVRGNSGKRGCEPHGSDPPLGGGSGKYKGFASRRT